MQVSLHGHLVVVTVLMVAKWPRSLERKDLTGGKNRGSVRNVLGKNVEGDSRLGDVLRCLV